MAEGLSEGGNGRKKDGDILSGISIGGMAGKLPEEDRGEALISGRVKMSITAHNSFV